MPVLSVRGLSIDYLTRRGPVHAVRDVSFELEKSETLAIIGESGSGKTTLAVGLIRLSPRGTKVAKGEILYTKDGITNDIRKLDDDDLREYRWAECAMVFQAALNSFNPVITIWEQFLDTARAHGLNDRRRVHDRAAELLDLVHLDAGRVLPAFPHELSGGMKQRVLIALALMLEPQMVILDEPTTALDILTQRSIIDLLRQLRQRLGFSMIFISHDLSIAAGALGSVASIPGSPPDLIRLPKGCTYAARCPYAIDACREADPPLLPVDTPQHEAACIRWQHVAEVLGSDAEIPVAEKLA